MIDDAATLTAPLERFSAPPLPKHAAIGEIRPLAPVGVRQTAPPVIAETPIDGPNPEWVRRLCLALLEALHSRRPTAQLRGSANAKLVSQLELRKRFLRPTANFSLTSVRIARVNNEVAEASATFEIAERAFPLAVRLERTAEGWIATSLAVGPH